MDKNYKPIKSMKEVPEQLRKLRRQYLRYQQAEIIYSISHKKLFELASDGDYFIPNLTLSEEEEQRAVGVWGQRHLSCF